MNDQIYKEGVHIKGMWPVSDRVASNYVCEFFDKDDNYVQICFDTEKNEYEKKGAVHINTHGLMWHLIKIDDQKTKIVHYSNGDGKLSSMPKWVIKKGMADSIMLPLKIVTIQEGGLPLEEAKK